MAHCDEALERIGRSCRSYQADHEGRYPARLDDLIDAYGLTVWDLVCPASPAGAGGCSYVYRGADLFEGVPGEMIVAYDRQGWHRGRRNVLFADGTVRRPPEAAFEKAIRQDNEFRRQLLLAEKPAEVIS